MTKIEVYEPAMCCSTGVCGSNVDPALVRFAGTADWLTEHGIVVERYNLSQSPRAFAANATVRAVLQEKGADSLPLVLVDGKVAWTGNYPTQSEVVKVLGLPDAPTRELYTDAVAELVSIGAAIASGCEPCFRYHYDRARKLGVSRADMWAAVQTAQAVKETPAQSILTLAARYVGPRADGGGADEASDGELPMVQSKRCC